MGQANESTKAQGAINESRGLVTLAVVGCGESSKVRRDLLLAWCTLGNNI